MLWFPDTWLSTLLQKIPRHAESDESLWTALISGCFVNPELLEIPVPPWILEDIDDWWSGSQAEWPTLISVLSSWDRSWGSAVRPAPVTPATTPIVVAYTDGLQRFVDTLGNHLASAERFSRSFQADTMVAVEHIIRWNKFAFPTVSKEDMMRVSSGESVRYTHYERS
jgi:hypothetical protein